MLDLEVKVGELVAWVLPLILAYLAAYTVYRFTLRISADCRGATTKFGAAYLTGLVTLSVLSAALFLFEIPRPPTRYAEGYSRLAFNEIRVGDSEMRVRELLGDPLPLEWVEDHILHYTWPAKGRGGRAYVRRVIVLDPKVRDVVRIVSEVQP